MQNVFLNISVKLLHVKAWNFLMRRLIVLKNVNSWWLLTFSKWLLKYSSPGKLTVCNTLIGQDTCQLFQVFVCNNMVLESRQRSLRKSRLLWAYNCYLTVSQANSVNSLQLSWCLYFVLSFFSKFISMRDGLEEWTRENFLFSWENDRVTLLFFHHRGSH